MLSSIKDCFCFRDQVCEQKDFRLHNGTWVMVLSLKGAHLKSLETPGLMPVY